MAVGLLTQSPIPHRLESLFLGVSGFLESDFQALCVSLSVPGWMWDTRQWLPRHFWPNFEFLDESILMGTDYRSQQCSQIFLICEWLLGATSQYPGTSHAVSVCVTGISFQSLSPHCMFLDDCGSLVAYSHPYGSKRWFSMWVSHWLQTSNPHGPHWQFQMTVGVWAWIFCPPGLRDSYWVWVGHWEQLFNA